MATGSPSQTEPNDSGAAQVPPSSAGEQRKKGEAAKNESAAESLNAALTNIAEIAAYLRLFVTAKLDSLKLTALKVVLISIVALLAGVGILALFFATIVLICVGVADAFAALFHSRWLGELTAGILILGAIALTIGIVFRQVFQFSYSQTRAKYEARLQQMRQSFRSNDRGRHE